eukprot:CAMPEP_0116895364 /NCGR_PEP_ID=MMETSP0467-20121206/4906_1 /TAXON_ID=283647 /ORGANISM="Mesodinium pulex, Strain SPMC105" /LENGTH=68 /DNA_ID=CAMNT_0004566057 /DNA_START=567 /DNA_END=773 /DNA_ORIENTATION=-
MYYFNDCFYLIMEKAGEINLFDYRNKMDKGCFSYNTTKFLMFQIFNMIKAFNDVDLIHRDIKMKNFVV